MIKLLIFATIFLQASPEPISILIQNPSFEQLPAPLVSNRGCGLFGQLYYYPRIPGWTFSIDGGGGGGIFQPSNPNYPCYTKTAPDGETVAFAQNATLSQDTGIKPSDLQAKTRQGIAPGDGLFMMTFYVANDFVNYPGYYEAKISLGTTDINHVIHVEQELCSTDGWATVNWNKVTLTCPSPGYLIFDRLLPSGAPADPNAHLIVSLSMSKGWPLLFDNVSLTFTPN